jgi:hypothetical protein
MPDADGRVGRGVIADRDGGPREGVDGHGSLGDVLAGDRCVLEQLGRTLGHALVQR